MAVKSAAALTWVENLPKQKWTQAYDGGIRWGHMTSSLVEAMNSMFKDICCLSITTLVQSTYYRMAKLYAKRGKQSTTVLASGQQYTKAFQERILDAVHKSNSYTVDHFDRQNYTFLVHEIEDPDEGRPMDHFKVDLQEKLCECGKFQALHLPCSYAIAACSRANISYLPYIDEVYKDATVFAVYDEAFPVVRSKSMWPDYLGPIVFPRTDMKRIKRGRPKKTRIRTEMDDFEKREQRCGLCRVPGHEYNKCSNAGGPST